ncbi:MAG: GAF domain-containing protein [Myxococcota bacterium]
MDATDYAKRVGVEVERSLVREAQTSLWNVLEEAKKRSLPATPSALNQLYLIQVPRLSADGSCSLHGELDPTPYDLGKVLGGRTTRTSMCLLILDELLEHVANRTGLEWLGVYQARDVGGGQALVKVAYSGKPSRAEFPLTDDFAKLSNNVAVALSGKARVIQDVKAHVGAGGAYYECDKDMQSEACLPLLDAKGAVVGILDAESAQKNGFTGERLAMLAVLATEVVSHLP